MKVTHGIYTITSYRGHVAAAVHHLYVCPQVRLTALLQLRLEGSGARTHTLSLSYGHAHTHTRTYTAVGQIKRFLPVTEAGSALREETRPSVCVRSRLGSVRLGPVRTVISGVCPGAAAGLCRRRRKSAETKLRSVFLRPQPDCQTKTHTRNIRSQPSK